VAALGWGHTLRERTLANAVQVPNQPREITQAIAGARSFAEFWRLWNSVYGYFLGYFVYRPLARRLPRPLAAIATFVACGFLLHDLPVHRRVLEPDLTSGNYRPKQSAAKRLPQMV
jgi:MBOAT, membrane-bound O-acyltransferase family